MLAFCHPLLFKDTVSASVGAGSDFMNTASLEVFVLFLCFGGLRKSTLAVLLNT